MILSYAFKPIDLIFYFIDYKQIVVPYHLVLLIEREDKGSLSYEGINFHRFQLVHF
jgi:hypothetical protein